MKMFEEATKESNKEVLVTAIKKGRDLGLSTLLLLPRFHPPPQKPEH